ncbi:TIGR03960 family B12-binding radical SAM protein [bacterium]|nr:TIGR03960 family B12-binding radical SAM protein [bacterium]
MTPCKQRSSKIARLQDSQTPPGHAPFSPRSGGAELYEQLVRPRLLELRKPARYIGEEQGQIRRDWDNCPAGGAPFRLAYSFPDLYEIGMSYHGRELIYQRINARPDAICERVFVPDRDMESLLRETGAPLFSLESKRPLRSFDAVGISFTYELAYPSALLLLELGGIALYSAERGEDDPFVIAGGQCMCNPEPIAPFFDIVCNGEGEETLDAIIDSLKASRGRPRAERLLELATLQGVYIPSLYEPLHDENGRLLGTRPSQPGLPLRIQRRYVTDFASTMPPTRPVLPYIEVPSDKVYLEVMRGCPQGCRFCQAGYITRPARARPVELLAQAAAELVANTGADEVSLMSLSTLDHPQVFDMIEAVKAAVPEDVSVGLPSLRADRMSAELANMMRKKRESSLTIAVEAGSDAARRAIRKGVTEEDVLHTFDFLMAAGWHKFKLYFMMGFAGEPLSAMDDIAGLVAKIMDLARAKGYRRPRLVISCSVLVPKPHSPLQWQGMERPEQTREKQRRLKFLLARFGRSVEFKHHDSAESVIETLVSRGGREIAAVVYSAFRLGQSLPSDYFSYSAWAEACAEHGIDIEHEVHREREYDEALPWDHVSRGVGRKYLWREWEYYHSGDANPACHVECTSCGLGCNAPVFDPDSRAVPAGLKDYFGRVAASAAAEMRGLRPFSPVYPEDLDPVYEDGIELSGLVRPRVAIQRRGTSESQLVDTRPPGEPSDGQA